MKPVVLRPAAERDIQEIHDWYETRREGLGEEFLEEVERTLTLIEHYPQAFTSLRARPIGALASSPENVPQPKCVPGRLKEIDSFLG